MIRSFITAATLLIAAAAFAQKPAVPVAPATTTQTIVDTDSRQTRHELESILRSYPPEVGAVLKLDPTLLTNESYMANYPALATFAAQHPGVVHNPTFYFENVDSLTRQSAFGMRRDRTFEAREIMGDLGGFLAFLVVTSVFVWAIKMLIEQRRWSRMIHLQTEVHGKLLDRFTSNEELLAYIQTPSGRRILEAAPLPLEGAPRPVSAPVSRIFWSLQVGLVAIALGVGFDLVSLRAQGDASEALYGIGVISLLIGVAFVLSAIVFYVLGKKFALWTPPAPAGSDSE